MCLVVLAGLIGILATHSYSGTLYHGKGRHHIELDHIFNGTFSAHSKLLEWVPEGIWVLLLEASWLPYFTTGDGVFSSTDDKGNVSLINLQTNTSEILIKHANMKDVS